MNESFENQNSKNVSDTTIESPSIDSTEDPIKSSGLDEDRVNEKPVSTTPSEDKGSEVNSERIETNEENPFQGLMSSLEANNENFQKKINELRKWGEAHNIQETLSLQDLNNQEKLDRVFDALIESELKNNDDENDHEEESEQKRSIAKEKLMDILAKGANNLDQWLTEGTQVTLNDGMLRFIEAVFGDYYGSSSSRIEKSSGKEGDGNLITTEGFFGQINSDPNRFANIIYNAYDQELKFSGWNPGSEALNKLTEAKRSSPEKAKKILQKIMTGLKSENGEDFNIQTSLVKYLKESSDEVSAYRWQVASKAIGEGLGAKGLSIEVKNMLDNIANQKTKAAIFFKAA